jgi:carboxylesterase type B
VAFLFALTRSHLLSFRHCCMQPGHWSDISEDCLTLNVFTPQNATFGTRPHEQK